LCFSFLFRFGEQSRKRRRTATDFASVDENGCFIEHSEI